MLELAIPFFQAAAAAAAGPTHTAVINIANAGYNGVLGRGSIDSATFTTPGGKSVTITHCRRVSAEVNFALTGPGALAADDFPVRIVATKTTGGEVERIFVPQAGSLRQLTGAGTLANTWRQDYDPESGAAADVFVNNQTVRVDIYY